MRSDARRAEHTRRDATRNIAAGVVSSVTVRMYGTVRPQLRRIGVKESSTFLKTAAHHRVHFTTTTMATRVKFRNLTPETEKDLRALNSVIFPVRYAVRACARRRS